MASHHTKIYLLRLLLTAGLSVSEASRIANELGR